MNVVYLDLVVNSSTTELCLTGKQTARHGSAARLLTDGSTVCTDWVQSQDRRNTKRAKQSSPFQTFRALPNVVALPFFFGTLGGLQSGHVEPWIRRRDLGVVVIHRRPSFATLAFCRPRGLGGGHLDPSHTLAEIDTSRCGATLPDRIGYAAFPRACVFGCSPRERESPVPWCGRRQNWSICPLSTILSAGVTRAQSFLK
ncbi:uncharacterized protein BDZ83DRAFT_401713 [Colletotrichum acutatum]|uniref:Uncharacterized protein n=1 Tax=Glomerella acutata TaxID=27357 RepID=A0AAD8XMW0_GLOAC|nr:uncharacterized protein BDZ83DRAFT_401713 [Colletotrichum acutatum]KAK1730333.1 hypothetical protein BDZ83DRAFT_401713 [Colletotrichum acutatum]